MQDLSRITVEFWEGAAFESATVSLSNNIGGDGRRALLLGNTSAVYRLGVARWTDLRIDVSTQTQLETSSLSSPTIGSSFFLTFRVRSYEWTEGGLTVSHAQPDHYLIWVQPGSGQGGSPLLVGPVVGLVDRFDNRAESISEGVVSVKLVNSSAVASSLYPGPAEAIGAAQVTLYQGLANFSLSGLGSKTAAIGLRFNFSGRGLAPVPGVSLGWTFPLTSAGTQYSIYLFYSHKSTNSDSARAAALYQPLLTYTLKVLHQLYSLYQYKNTDTDT